MKNSAPTSCFWFFTGLAIAIASVGFSWSLIRASNYKLETANHKLEVNTAVEQIKKEISDTVKDVRYLSTNDQKKLETRLTKATEVLIETQEDILEDAGAEPSLAP